jgi:hypothetical protein
MKIVSALLLSFLASTASAQVDDRLFADYVHRVVECCPGRSVVVFYSRAEPVEFGEYLEEFQSERPLMVPLDGPAKGLGASIKSRVSSRTVAVAYDLRPDAIRILAEVADKSGAITISTTEEDVYVTSFSFDSVGPDRFRSKRAPAGCTLEKCGLTFHSDKVEPSARVRRAMETFLNAHKKLEPLRKERKGTSPNAASLVVVARLLQHALRHVPEDTILNGEWHDVYAPHYHLGEVFAYFANCEAAEIEWTASLRQLERRAPAVFKELEKLRKQNCD